MSPTPNLVDEESPLSILARAFVLGGLVGVLETVLVLSSGFSSPAAIAYDFGVLVAVFTTAASLSVLVRRGLGLRWLGVDLVLLLVAILIFSSRGCLRDCGESALWRMAFPTVLAVSSALLIVGTRRTRPSIREGMFMVVATLAATLAALDLADREASLLAGSGLPVVVLMVVLGAAGSAVALRGLGPSLVGTLIGGLVCFAWAFRDANQIASPLRIELARTRQPPTGKKDPPNVLLIVMDSVRADHLGVYGYSTKTSPHLDALAGESLVFDRAIASGNYSLSSHASLFTGRLPSEHGARPRWANPVTFRGIQTMDSALAADVPTLAERLESAGFATGGLSANTAYLARWTGLQRGFATFDDRPKRLLGYHPFSFPIQRRFGLPGPTQRTLEEWEGKFVTAAALSFAKGTARPFFLFLNYFDVHPREGDRPKANGLGMNVRPIPAYDAEIAAIDSAIGTLLEGLERSGTLDHTIVVITSDHGEFLGEKGFNGHGTGAYEEILHVPLLVRFPERLPAGRVGKAFGLHEAPRLILDLVEGRSIDWVYAGDEEPRVLSQIWGLVTSTDKSQQSSLEPDANIVYSGLRKLIARLSGQDELYDLATDSREERNLLLKEDSSASALREEMLVAVRKLAPARAGPLPNMTTADVERLRGLGYISLEKPKRREP